MTIVSWLASSLVRHYPSSLPPATAAPLHLDGCRNGRLSAQVVVRAQGEHTLEVRIRVAAPDGWQTRARRVGYVPVRHLNTPVSDDPLETEGRRQIPGYVPDVLFEDDHLTAPAGETHAFWLTLFPGGCPPGDYDVQVVVEAGGRTVGRHCISVHISDVLLQPRAAFHITHWLYADALIDWYHTDLFDERFWAIAARYMENLADHGPDTVYVPVLTPPVDGVKRPTQLLHVTRLGEDRYAFGWGDVRRYVHLALESGLTQLEWSHLFSQWGARQALRVYEGQGRDERLLWPAETAAASPTYVAFLRQYLPALKTFLDEEGLSDFSHFHLSDEPHGDEQRGTYGEARAVLRDLAPWMRVMDALTQMEFARDGLVDMPVPSIEVAPSFVAAGIPCWCYYCCEPRGPYLNWLLDTPLAKIAMHGLLFYRWPFRGFLHWGYNYWYRRGSRELLDPFCEQDGLAWQEGWAYGDPFRVYPGLDGPLDAIRWEVFAEAMDDYALLQSLGVPRDDPILSPIVSFADFPKSVSWRASVRRQLLARATAR